jgi:electron transfer flavoprotein beta subunit
MRDIIVLVKSALDESELKIDASGRPIMRGAPTRLSNFDRIGMEEALRLREGLGGTVTVLSMGPADATRAMKEALAMGADKGLLLLVGEEEESSQTDALATASALSEALERFQSLDMVLCSEGSSDTYQGQVGAMVAEMAGLPFLAYAKNVSVDEAVVRCEQIFDARTLVSETRLPAVVSMVNGANHPRYPTLLQVMAAARKPIEVVSYSSMRSASSPRSDFELGDVRQQQPQARKRVLFEGDPHETVRKMVAALRSEGAI